MEYTLTIQSPGGDRKVHAAAGENLLVALQRAGYTVPAPCGGGGRCGKCVVYVDRPSHCPPNEREAALLTADLLAAGARLGCTRTVDGDLTLRVLQVEQALIRTDGWETPFALMGDVSFMTAVVPPATLEEPESDEKRLLKMLNGADGAAMTALRSLPGALRARDGRVSAVVRAGVVLEAAAGEGGSPWGVAVDIGTTTMVAYLMDLISGQSLGVASCLNPQKAHGDDVITRTDYSFRQPGGLAELRKMAVDAVNGLVAQLTQDAGASPRRVYKMALAGNTVMLHLFTGVSPQYIAAAPFTPAFTAKMSLGGGELCLAMHPEGEALILPCVAGYVGADTVAAVLATRLLEADRPCLMIDIGTNGEMVLGSREGLLACSVAAGPAFEGAHIRHGMGGVAGAISVVDMKEDGVSARTIADGPARGMCGSAIVDVTAELLRLGMLDDTGRLTPGAHPFWNGRMTEEARGWAVTVASRTEGAEQDVVFCQRDVREVQLAKGAVAAGIEVLVRQMGIALGDIGAVYLAGGFGSYINPERACRIGLLPGVLLPVIRSVGNGAGAGARRALLSTDEWALCDEIQARTRYIELSSRADFQDLFVEKMLFASQ